MILTPEQALGMAPIPVPASGSKGGPSVVPESKPKPTMSRAIVEKGPVVGGAGPGAGSRDSPVQPTKSQRVSRFKADRM